MSTAYDAGRWVETHPYRASFAGILLFILFARLACRPQPEVVTTPVTTTNEISKKSPLELPATPSSAVKSLKSDRELDIELLDQLYVEYQKQSLVVGICTNDVTFATPTEVELEAKLNEIRASAERLHLNKPPSRNSTIDQKITAMSLVSKLREYDDPVDELQKLKLMKYNVLIKEEEKLQSIYDDIIDFQLQLKLEKYKLSPRVMTKKSEIKNDALRAYNLVIDALSQQLRDELQIYKK